MSGTFIIISDVLPGPPGPPGPIGPAGTSEQVDKILTYDILGRLDSVTDSLGVKTMTYNLQGQLASIIGTGSYQSKTFNYDVNGNLISVDVT
jgi:YD repeat-containing protein